MTTLPFLSFVLLATSMHGTSGRIRTSEAIGINGINDDALGSGSKIPDSFVGMEEVSKLHIPGQPLDPGDFMKAAEIQIVNAPPIDGEDPIMAAKEFQGDIVIPDPEVLTSLNNYAVSDQPQKNAIKDDKSKWSNGVIPYAISAEYDTNERAIIAKAMGVFHSDTCIRFVPRNVEKDYIFIKKGSGCSSAVGRVGGQQAVTLGNGCVYYGIVIHELMHATGFWHEQSRNDRDSFVTVIWNNIQKGMNYNFHKYGWDIIQDLGVLYDTGSIMHYGSYAFAIDKSKPTIIANNGNEIGQRTHLSKKDMKKLNALYQCDSDKVVIAPPEPVVETGCVDSSEFCGHWSQSGECDKNPAWMHNNCQKSCNKCKNVCKDDNNECGKWAKAGHCSKSAVYMTKHCKLSCGTCEDKGSTSTTTTTECKDKNQFCPEWSKSGECRANPNYMLSNCMKSCKQC